jgi:hypothetical protein
MRPKSLKTSNNISIISGGLETKTLQLTKLTVQGTIKGPLQTYLNIINVTRCSQGKVYRAREEVEISK